MRSLFSWICGAVVAAALAAPASAAWHEVKSEHFTIYADENGDVLRRYAQKLERFDAAVREGRGIPDVKPGAATRVTLYLVRDLAALRRIYGDREASVGGFYIPKASGSVAFIPEVSERGKFGLSAESIFMHEYSHHLMLQDADRPLPTWVTEGFAEFFANPEFKPDGSVVVGHAPAYRAEALLTSEKLPLQKMLSGDYTYLTGMEWESIYGRGWLLTHFLTFELHRRGQLTKYLDELERGVPGLQAAQNAFGDLKALDRELAQYFKRPTRALATIQADKLKIGPVAVRALGTGEAELIEVQTRLARGGEKLFPKSLAGKARSVASAYPNDARVQTILSQAENAAGNHAAALQAADRALALDPQSFDALMAKGRAMLAAGEAAPANTDWNGMRAAFLAANKIDQEAAEPLVLFHRSFVKQGVKPTKNAVDGLFYAVVLAPQDNQLRMELIGRLIEDNRLADARRAIVPVAYSPHRGKWKEAAVAILEQLDARNQAQARAKWQAAQKYFDED